jgi:hypothetical protein
MTKLQETRLDFIFKGAITLMTGAILFLVIDNKADLAVIKSNRYTSYTHLKDSIYQASRDSRQDFEIEILKQREK